MLAGIGCTTGREQDGESRARPARLLADHESAHGCAMQDPRPRGYAITPARPRSTCSFIQTLPGVFEFLNLLGKVRPPSAAPLSVCQPQGISMAQFQLLAPKLCSRQLRGCHGCASSVICVQCGGRARRRLSHATGTMLRAGPPLLDYRRPRGPTALAAGSGGHAHWRCQLEDTLLDMHNPAAKPRYIFKLKSQAEFVTKTLFPFFKVCHRAAAPACCLLHSA